jgi:hypothetical protein
MGETKAIPRDEFSQYEFVNCFIAALVCLGKRHIWIRGGHEWIVERDRMHRLYRFMNHAVNFAERRGAKKSDKDFFHFLVRLRNEVAPSNIGSFEGTLNLFRGKLLTWTSQNPPFFEYYKLDVSKTTCQWHLDHAPLCMRRMGEAAARVYMIDLKRRR